MFKKIIWATDGSNAADLALAHAKTLAKDADGELLIVHCEEWIAPGPRSGHYPVHADEDDIKAKIKGQRAEIGTDGAKTSLKVVETSASGAAHAIADIARDEHADVIVVGARGHTALAGLLLGSVTQRLLHIAPCPVRAVPQATAKPTAEPASPPQNQGGPSVHNFQASSGKAAREWRA